MLNIVNNRYNKLVAVKFIETVKKHSYWLFKCDCGKEKVLRVDSVLSGKTKSCGCIMKETHPPKHGQARTKLYHVYHGMKQRCYNENDKAFKWYGKKGIKICDEWLMDYSNFYLWAIQNGYKEGLTIDRIDYKKNYEPSNCRWITQAEQCNNTNRNYKITHNGKTLNINQWAKTLGINKNTMWNYVRNKHYTIEEILNIKNSRDYSERK